MLKENNRSNGGIPDSLILGVIFASFSMRSPMGTVGPVMSSVMESLSLSAWEGGMLTTLPLWLFALSAVLCVPVSEKIGLPKLIELSFLVIILGVVIRSMGNRCSLFLGTALIGLGTGFLNVGVPSFFKEFYPDFCGFLIGLYSSSLMCASALTAAVIEPIETIVASWRMAFLSVIIFPLGASLFFLPFLKAEKNGEKKEAKIENSGSLIRGRNILIAVFTGLQSLIFFTILTWYPTIIEKRGNFGFSTGILITITQVASLFPAYLIPVITNRKNITVLSFLMPLLFIPGIITAYLSSNPLLVVLSTFLFGLSEGATFSLGIMMCSIYGENGHDTARIMSLSQAIGYAEASFAPSLFGRLYDITSNWDMTIALLVVISSIMSLVSLFIRSSSR